jgi:hypothetical protein
MQVRCIETSGPGFKYPFLLDGSWSCQSASHTPLHLALHICIFTRLFRVGGSTCVPPAFSGGVAVAVSPSSRRRRPPAGQPVAVPDVRAQPPALVAYASLRLFFYLFMIRRRRRNDTHGPLDAQDAVVSVAETQCSSMARVRLDPKIFGKKILVALFVVI